MRSFPLAAILLALVGQPACGPIIYVQGPPAGDAKPPPIPTSEVAPEDPYVASTEPTKPGDPPTFFKTQDSNAWVTETFKLQKRYTRVLVVGSPAPATLRVGVLDLNAPGVVGEATDYPVAASFATLQEAANQARGGDLVAVLPGTYAGFVVQEQATAGDGSFIHFKAMGNPGDVTINRGSSDDPNWMLYVRAAHHLIIQGFNLAGNAEGPRAGIMLDGDFGRTGKVAHHIAVVENFSHHHRSWGLHSTDTHSVLIQDNVFAFSVREHGAYASDGSDNYVVRRNVFFNNRSSGFQANLDPEASFDEVMTHSAFRGHTAKAPTRAWAQELVKKATEQFGEHNFPDGRGVNFIIENNVMNGNGKGGGAAINLAALSDSLIQNNLIYGNSAHGIAQWDNANPFDESYVKPGPSKPEQVTGPESLPLFGCQNNVIRNNTVLMDRQRRAAIQCGNGSFGCLLRNNIAINDSGPSIEILNTSIFKLDASHNVINQIVYENMDPALKSLAVSLPETQTTTGVTTTRIKAEVIRAGDEPWIVVEGNWWKLNPNRPDFRPKPWSRMLMRKGDADSLPPLDLAGQKRMTADLGAFNPPPP